MVCWDMVGVGLGLVNELRGYLYYMYLPTYADVQGGGRTQNRSGQA